MQLIGLLKKKVAAIFKDSLELIVHQEDSGLPLSVEGLLQTLF